MNTITLSQKTNIFLSYIINTSSIPASNSIRNTLPSNKASGFFYFSLLSDMQLHRTKYKIISSCFNRFLNYRLHFYQYNHILPLLLIHIFVYFVQHPNDYLIDNYLEIVAILPIDLLHPMLIYLDFLKSILTCFQYPYMIITIIYNI